MQILGGLSVTAPFAAGQGARRKGGSDPGTGPAAKPEDLRLGVCTYSFREFQRRITISLIRQLSVRWVSVKDFHLSYTASPGELAKATGDFQRAGLTIASGGTIPLRDEDPRALRRYFEYARACGMPMMVSAPTHKTLPAVEALVKEFDIKVAIHNHGPGANYDKLADVVGAIEKWPVEIGACVDTGHFIRSGEDPVAALRTLGPRVHEVHLKDATGVDVFNILGQGKLDVVGTLRALKDIKFDGCLALEYELNKNDPMADVRACLAYARDAAGRM